MLILDDLVVVQPHAHDESTKEGTIGCDGMCPCYPPSGELQRCKQSMQEQVLDGLTVATTSPSLYLGAICMIGVTYGQSMKNNFKEEIFRTDTRCVA